MKAETVEARKSPQEPRRESGETKRSIRAADLICVVARYDFRFSDLPNVSSRWIFREKYLPSQYWVNDPEA